MSRSKFEIVCPCANSPMTEAKSSTYLDRNCILHQISDFLVSYDALFVVKSDSPCDKLLHIVRSFLCLNLSHFKYDDDSIKEI